MVHTTKNAIATSFVKLMQNNTLSNISIKDITDDCGLNRQTFYYHFEDVYDLMRWVFDQERQKFLSSVDFNSWQEGVLRAFDEAVANKKLIINTYRSLGREHLEKYLGGVLEDIIGDVVGELTAGFEIEEEDKRFIVKFYAYALLGFVLDWISGDMKADPVLIVGRLAKLIEGDFIRNVERFSL